MEYSKFQDILSLIVDFAKTNDQILAVGLCGSRARGTAGPDSDIDLSILVNDRLLFKETEWIEHFDFKKNK